MVDLLDAATTGMVVPVYFTYGDRRIEHTSSPGRRQISLGKAHLVSRLQTLLQCHRLHLPPKMEEARVLADDLLEYEIRVDENANDRYGAFRVGRHDDLVTALGLAVQEDVRLSPWEMIGLGD